MNFIQIPGRDAHATFAGFVFQVNVTILRWLRLRPDQHLELEAGEDIDLIRKAGTDVSQDSRLLEQVKQLRKQRLTLTSADALEAVAHLCEHRKSNPGANLTFRFLTTTTLTRERRWKRGGTAIETWARVQSGELAGPQRTAAISDLHTFLSGCRRPKSLSKDSWECLRAILAQPDQAEFTELITSLDWATGSGDHVAIENEILTLLESSEPSRSPETARRVYRDLFAYVFRLLTTADKKQLTTALLAQEIEAPTLTPADLLAAARLREWIDNVDSILARHEKEIQELKARIPAERLRTFYEQEGSTEHSSRSGPLFDYNQTLRGRQTRLAELGAFLSDPVQRIAVLPGRGGIGKTKLLRDWSRTVSGWKVLWVSKHGVWYDGTASEIPATDTVIVADDAHHYEYLDKLICLVGSRPGEPRLKLVIATRPSGNAYLDELLSRLADDSSIVRCKTLRPLSQAATVEIAKEMLGPQFEHLANRLAEVSKDTPLITVVGGKLLARGQVSPDLLVNDREFQHAVFTAFREELTRALPSGGRQSSELLELIAAVQPIDDRQDEFVPRASVFLSLRPDQIRRGLGGLEGNELLTRVGEKLRIVPDLLADYMLGNASVLDNGKATGFADAVFAGFEDAYLSNLLKNFAELDWRVTQSGIESRLLENIWSSVRSRFRTQDAADRRHFLSMTQGIVIFQPEQVQQLIAVAMDEPVPPVKKWGILRSTQEHVLTEIPPLLGATIYHDKTATDAFRRLWRLARHDSEAVHGPARRTLAKAIGYDRYKNPIFNERILTLTEQFATDLNAYDGDFTPLDLMDELLDREIDTNEWKGRSFSISAMAVPYELIRPLRERAFLVIDHALYSSEPRITVRAAGSLGSVLAEFHPKFRNGTTPEEQAWQDAERLRVVGLLRKRVEAGNLSLQLTWQIHRVLRGVSRRHTQSSAVRDAAALLNQQLPHPDGFDLFDLLCTNEYEDNTEIDGFSLPSPARREYQTASITALRTNHPTTAAQVQYIEDLLRPALAASIDPVSVDSVLSELCGDHAFLEALSGFARDNQQSLLGSVAGVAVRHWRRISPEQYRYYGRLFAASQSVRMAGSVASAVSYGPPLEEPIQADLDILTVLAGRPEPYVLRPVFFGLRRLTKVSEFRTAAISLITRVAIGNRKFLAKEYCGIFGPYGISPSLLDQAGVEKMLANLVEVDELDHDSFGGFLANVCGIAPLAIVSFFETRIQHAQAFEDRGEDTDYDAIPSSFSWSTLSSVRVQPEFEQTLNRLITLMKRYPRYEHELSPIFWHIATADVTTFTVLDELLHTSDPDDALLLLKLLSEAPKGLAIHHPAFAMHILERCSSHNEQLEGFAMSRLRANCFSAGGFQAVQPGAAIYMGSGPSDEAKTRVASLLADLPPSSLAFKLYTEIAGMCGPTFTAPVFPDPTEELEDSDV
jgi:hypothetical protein